MITPRRVCAQCTSVPPTAPCCGRFRETSLNPMPQHSSSDPSYRREAVAIGPFTDEPLDLLPVLCELPDGSWRTGDEIRAGSREWLTAALYSTGVALGDHDR